MKKHNAKFLLFGGLLTVLLAGCGGDGFAGLKEAYRSRIQAITNKSTPFVPPLTRRHWELRLEAERLMRTGDYAAIEARMAQYRRTWEAFPDGTSKMEDFYYGLAGVYNSQEKTWFDMQQQLLVWRKKHPESKTAQIALAGNYIIGAVAALDDKEFKEATPEQRKLNYKRAEQGFQMLIAFQKVRSQYPEWFIPFAHLHFSNEKNRKTFDRAVDEGTKLYPQLYRLHYERAYHRTSVHLGKPGDWEKYTTKIADQLKGVKGDRFYANTVWYLMCLQEKPLTDLKELDWPRTQRGFEALLKDPELDPESVAGPYAMAAWIAGERDALRNLFNRYIDQQLDLTVWQNAEQFNQAREWAFEYGN